MILLIDIGNSAITLGVFKDKKIKYLDRVKIKKDKGISYYSKTLNNYFKRYKINKRFLESVVFCSVIPSFNFSFKKALKKLVNCKVLEVGKDLKIYVKNRYKNPKEVGIDRLMNAIAAHKTYSKSKVIIVDFGTAVTFDVVNKKGDYLGGIIIPGIDTSLKALSNSAELLPEITLMGAKGLIGKDTITSMQNGIIYATASACDGIINRLKKKFGKNTRVVATGGYANLIKRYSLSFSKTDSSLTLKGLYINYVNNMSKLKN